MTMDETNLEFDNIINTLKKKSENRTINIWLPSLAKGVKFKHLNIDQQKQLIKSSIRENLLKLVFSRNIYSIITDNIIDEEVNIDRLNTIDMISIGLAYRLNDISEDYGFYIDSKFYPVDLNEICNKIRQIDYRDTFKPETIISEGYHVTVQIPSINVDRLMNDHLYNKYKQIPDDDEQAKDILADLYIHEAAKYIKSIDIVSEGDNPDEPPITIEFSNFTAEQRLQAINTIPLTVLNKLVIVSDKVQKVESDILEVDLDGTQARIEINSGFFT